MQLPDYLKTFVSGDVWSTILLFVILLLIRVLLIRGLERNRDTLSETRRRWISIVQNTSVILIGLGLIFIWSPELSTFALSLTAFAVALVIATKEFLLCLIGAIYRTSARPFDVGDWIEVDGVRGEVISEGILTIRLHELGEGGQRYSYTGRILAAPNSLLLTHTVRNESFRKKFVHHAFSITMEPTVSPVEIRKIILGLIVDKSTPFDEVAERYWAMVRRKIRTDLPSREPSVSVETNHLAKVIFNVTVFCPTHEAMDIEETVTEAVLTHMHNAQTTAPVSC